MWGYAIFIASWMGLKDGDGSTHPSPRWVRTSTEVRTNGRHLQNGRRASALRIDPLHFPTHSPPDVRETRLQRIINVIVAVVGIVVAFPLMLLIALAVKLTSRGPVIFTQPRVGVDRRRYNPNVPVDPRRQADHGGRIFHIYKFRTMEHRPDRDQEQVWSSPADPRITPVGRLLRLYRLDELPQLFNVLRGDMNIVGPRPEQPAIFKDLRTRIDRYQDRQRVRPGITGLAQVNRSYDQSVDDVRHKVDLDLQYVQRQSTMEDIRIMLRTFPVILFRRGAC